MNKYAVALLGAVLLLSTPVVLRAQTPDARGFKVGSAALAENTMLERRYAAAERDCGGENISPAIEWSGEPDTTKSFAVTVYDPDGASGQGVVHWLGYNLSPTVHALAEGAMAANGLHATIGANSHGTQAYSGACPPYGAPHHYVYEVYALDLAPGTLEPELTRDQFLKAVLRHVVANDSMMFRYQRVQPAAAGPVADARMFAVKSSKYAEDAMLERRNVAAERDCGGENISPPIEWSGEPAATKSFAVVYYDPDGSNGQGEGHWLGYNLPPTVHALPEGAMTDNPLHATIGTNGHGQQEYYGACPPYGKRHHYVYEVYALDLPVGALAPGLTREQFLPAVSGHTVANASIVFRHQRFQPAPPAGR